MKNGASISRLAAGRWRLAESTVDEPDYEQIVMGQIEYSLMSELAPDNTFGDGYHLILYLTVY